MVLNIVSNSLSFMMAILLLKIAAYVHQLGDVAVFENRQLVTAAKFITKSSLFIHLPGVVRRLKLKLISEQKVESIFVAPAFCQAAAVLLGLTLTNLFPY